MSEFKTNCYECKHPISIQGCDGPLIDSNDIQNLDASLYEDVMKTDRILELASSDTQSTQVLCMNCLSQLITSLQKRIEEENDTKLLLENQLEIFSQQLEEDSGEDSTEEQIEELKSKIMEYKIEIKAQNNEFKSVQKDLNELVQKEQEFWKEASALEIKLLDFEESNAEVAQRMKIAEEELALLNRINVLNEIFYISSENQFGTISGLRLGRLDSDIVSWEEINAAWGQCVLLLSTLSRIKGFKSAQCNLYPLGSFSRIAPVHDDSNRFELFCSDTAFAKMIGRFNTGQQYYLDCLLELSLLMETEDPGLSLPYKIENHKIGQIPIKLDIGNKENWTRALRFMLQNLKYLLLRCIRD